jgi:AcrR family transcriptional regulator
MEINKEPNMEQAILDAAEKLFLEKGFAATSTTQIARAVGCNQALLHYYFRTKENLFNNIFEHKFRLFFQQVFDISGLNEMSFLDKIKHITESHFDLLAKNPKIPMLILNELSRIPNQLAVLREKLEDLPEQLFMMLQKDLQSEIEAGSVRNVDFLDIMITIVTLNVSLFMLLPVGSEILKLDDNRVNGIITHRREENVKIILSYLKP